MELASTVRFPFYILRFFWDPTPTQKPSRLVEFQKVRFKILTRHEK